MSLRCRVSDFSVFFATLLFSAFFAPFSEAQQPTGTGKALTVERIYSQPSLSGRLTRGLTWTPDGKQVSYFETKGLRPTNSNPFCRWTHQDRHKPPVLAAALRLNINGRPMARAFYFKGPRHLHGWM